MNVLVTGATGTLGRPVVRHLLEAGHQVRGLSRSDGTDARLRELGVEPQRADLFDLASLERAMTDTDAVLHLASKIPGSARLARREAWAETDRIRRDGTRNLVDAALKVGAQVFVYPSVVFLYPDSGAAWIDANTEAAPAEYLQTTLEAEREVARFAADGGRGISLRLGGFYGPDSSQTQEMLNLMRRGIAPVFGRDDAFSPTIWVDDAARAVVAAMLEAPSGVFDVVDDEPLTRRETRAVMAGAIYRSRFWRIPDILAQPVLGVVAGTLTRSQRVSNERFKAATSWKPEVKNAREGWARLASSAPTARSASSEARDQSRLSAWALAALTYLMLSGLLVGVWAQFAPRSFYDAFPGVGFAWVSVDGPYNEHLVRDVGGLNLALAVFAAVALVMGRRGFARAFGLATLAYQLPHLVYHVVHVGALPTTLEQILQTLTLALATVTSLGLLLERPRTRDATARTVRRLT